jgi:transposase-like protein
MSAVCCKHNQLERSKEGLCEKCAAKKVDFAYRMCKKQCFNCKECGYFRAVDNNGSLEWHPHQWMPKKQMVLYTVDMVKTSLALQWDHYYAQLAIGQSPTWKCDERTATLYCLSQWVMNVLIELNCPQEDRLKLQNFWNRKSRAEDELYAVAALTINNFLQGKIEPLPFHKK